MKKPPRRIFRCGSPLVFEYGPANFLPPLLTYRHKPEFEDEDVREERQPRGNDHVGEGVLFDEHGSQDNAESLDCDRYFAPKVSEDPGLRIPDRDHDGDGVVNVYAGRYVGRRVDRVQTLAKVSQNVVPWHCVGTEVEDVRKTDRGRRQ